MSESKTHGPALIVSILRKAKKPLTTKELHLEVRKVVSTCITDNAIALNLMRINGTIKGERIEIGPGGPKTWIWWIEDKESETST